MNSHSKSKSEVYFQYVKYYVALRRLHGQAVRSSRSFVLYFSSSRKKKNSSNASQAICQTLERDSDKRESW